MLNRKGKLEISGFWLFMIGIFIILPMVELIVDNKKEHPVVKDVKVKVASVSRRGKIVEIKRNVGTAAVNTQYKIPIKEGTVVAFKVSPDREKPEAIKIISKYAITTFNKVGIWEIDMKDANGELVEWIKITVY